MSRLRAALEWLARYNPFWRRRLQLQGAGLQLPPEVEDALRQYAGNSPEEDERVPESLVQAAVPVPRKDAAVQAAGPADAQADKEGQADAETFVSAAMIDNSLAELPAQQLWAKAVANAQLLDKCAARLQKAKKQGEQSQIDQQELQQTSLLLETVKIVNRLSASDVQSELLRFCRQDSNAQKGLVVAYGHTGEALSFFAPEFWPWSFMELMPFGDCGEHIDLDLFAGDSCYQNLSESHLQLRGAPGRIAAFRGKRWARSLLLRADRRRFRLHAEWVATAFSTMWQREQMHAIKLAIQRPSWSKVADDLASLKPEDLLLAAGQLGEHASVRDAMRSKDVPSRVKSLLMQVQITQQNVRCTDAYRHNMQCKFKALRVAHGSQLVYFTLNPADTKHQFSISFSCKETRPA